MAQLREIMHTTHAPSRSGLKGPPHAFQLGVRAAAPVILGAIPFATITGVAATNIGMPPLPTLTLSAIAFAGASQLAAFELMSQGAPIWVIVLTALVINLRYAMYSASIAPHFARLSLGWKLLIGWLLVDQVYAVSMVRFDTEEQFRGADGLLYKRWFALGMGITLWLPWILGVAAGVFLGVQAPTTWSLDFVIPLVFVAILFPALTDRPAIAAAVVGGGVAIFARNMPLNLGLLAGAGTGVLAGLLLEEWQQRSAQPADGVHDAE